jgi:hypothetical protein
MQVPIFHQCEIMAIDTGKRAKLQKTAETRHSAGYLTINLSANRGNCCVFFTVPKQDGPPVARTAQNGAILNG